MGAEKRSMNSTLKGTTGLTVGTRRGVLGFSSMLMREERLGRMQLPHVWGVATVKYIVGTRGYCLFLFCELAITEDITTYHIISIVCHEWQDLIFTLIFAIITLIFCICSYSIQNQQQENQVKLSPEVEHKMSLKRRFNLQALIFVFGGMFGTWHRVCRSLAYERYACRISNRTRFHKTVFASWVPAGTARLTVRPRIKSRPRLQLHSSVWSRMHVFVRACVCASVRAW